ncbi:MAG: VWA domain-containing protein [Planctomycetes bacterium]|nr:VWA domain-containing protein [Planctomycetota bacterium]
MERPRDIFERKGIPRVDTMGDPAIYFPDAEESDHNEAYDAGGTRGRQGGQGRAFLGVAAGGGQLAAPPAAPVEGPSATEQGTAEQYAHREENDFHRVADDPLSTFSVDVDTSSYSNTRRFIASSQLPPRDAVRIEEMLNYFKYDYAPPADGKPFSVHVESHAAPWAPKHRLVRIGLRGNDPEFAKAPPANLVFLVDVSGSMSEANKLPLVQDSLRLLVSRMREQDRISMVVYAGSAGLVLPPTSGAHRKEIEAAINNLAAGGSTNGGQGIQLAYQVAQDNFIKDGINRVLLCTDGDFNLGISSASGLSSLIEAKRQSGVFLSVLGFGMGNYADSHMQQLADKGNGNAAYIDSIGEARKVLVEQMTGTLWTIAKDVKIQVEFNPAFVAGYRLVGYEKRMLAARDFNDDKKDAGEIGAGHQVTALYEIVPAGQDLDSISIDPLKYQKPQAQVPAAASPEMLTVKLRFKAPAGDVSEKIEVPFTPPATDAGASPDFDFAAAVAMFGMMLRESEHKERANWGLAIELAKGGLGSDPTGTRKEFVELAQRAQALATKQ